LAAPREYELVLMLDPQLDAPARDALAQEPRGQIEASGALKHENSWGLRKMAYEIDRRTEADYRWMRFEASNELLDSLDHNLKIADGVLRFRIFKVDPSAPVIVPPAATAAPGPRERSGREDGGDSHPLPAPSVPDPAPAPSAEDSAPAPVPPTAEAPSEADSAPAPTPDAEDSAPAPAADEADPAPAPTPSAADTSGDADE
jgi:small subunit ribosomal protein S6